ncbi:hypothetical protein BQ8794_70024 [Mesorhizobium prunaredense]|uniref:Uncharacterized protein n=1 Tax=Mesorhizobium prunaredense TaxID=1631249 RepID=A0A1R3VGV2_9HYPH|nr:hypothetical protein BQ8794_70024 [Mesorhizobium prunaredense]
MEKVGFQVLSLRQLVTFRIPSTPGPRKTARIGSEAIKTALVDAPVQGELILHRGVADPRPVPGSKFDFPDSRFDLPRSKPVRVRLAGEQSV